jgi:ribosomal-protein-alanine N-acetyltransferase
MTAETKKQEGEKKQKKLEIKIREGREEDIEKVVLIEFSSFESPWSRNLLIRSIKKKELFVAEINGEVVGYIVFSKILDEVHLENIAVDERWRRKGIGSKLLEFLIQRSKESSIFLEVRPSNIPAINLYKKYGFREIGIRKNYYVNEDAIVMMREPEKIHSE